MSRSLTSAFDFILRLQGREMTLERDAGATAVTVKMANSNYFRTITGLEEAVIEGKEFVVSKRELDLSTFPTPERGDVIIDTELGVNSIVEVRDMVVFGNLVGYRLRTG